MLQPTSELPLMTIHSGASELMKQGHRYVVFLSASFLMGEHESVSMTQETRLTSLRQPTVAKKCGTGEEKREKKTVLASRQLSLQWS